MRHSVEILVKMTHFLCEGGLALNSQGDDIKTNIPVSSAMLRSTVPSCSCVNLQRFSENPHISNVKVTSRRTEQCAQSMLPAQIRRRRLRGPPETSQLFDTLKQKLSLDRNFFKHTGGKVAIQTQLSLQGVKTLRT